LQMRDTPCRTPAILPPSSCDRFQVSTQPPLSRPQFREQYSSASPDMPPCGGSRYDERSAPMKSTTIRSSATALGIAAVTGLAGIGFAGGPAMADSAGLADSTSQAAAADTDVQSVHFPTDPTTYADEL